MMGRRRCGIGLAIALVALDPEFTTVWRGGGEHQGVVILGTPLGHEDFVRAQLEHIVEEHNVLLERIPSVTDVFTKKHGLYC